MNYCIQRGPQKVLGSKDSLIFKTSELKPEILIILKSNSVHLMNKVFKVTTYDATIWLNVEQNSYIAFERTSFSITSNLFLIV